jgi:hypothetical protein
MLLSCWTIVHSFGIGFVMMKFIKMRKSTLSSMFMWLAGRERRSDRVEMWEISVSTNKMQLLMCYWKKKVFSEHDSTMFSYQIFNAKLLSYVYFIFHYVTTFAKSEWERQNEKSVVWCVTDSQLWWFMVWTWVKDFFFRVLAVRY